MKNKRKNGFVLTFVIVAIAVIGVEMFALAGVSKIMLFQSNMAYLQACQRNLAASGLAWAKQNIQNNSREAFYKTVELDVAEMNIRSSTVGGVTVCIPTDEEPVVQISTSCSRGRRTVRSDGEYKTKP